MTPAQRAIAAFEAHQGWTYDLNAPSVPRWIEGCPRGVPSVEDGAPRRTNCTALVAWCLLAAFPRLRDLEPDPARPRTPPLWGAVNEWQGYPRFAGVSLLSGLLAPGDLRQPGLYYTQSWGATTGHARLVEVRASDLVVREASQSRGGVVERLAPLSAPSTWGETRAVRIG